MSREQFTVYKDHGRPESRGEAGFEIDFATGAFAALPGGNEELKREVLGFLRELARSNTADLDFDYCLAPIRTPFPMNDRVSLGRALLCRFYRLGGSLADVQLPPIPPTPPGVVN